MSLLTALLSWATVASQEPPPEDELPAVDATITGEKIYLLDFEFQALRMIRPLKGPYKGKVFWYMLYTLRNKSAEDVDFFLSINAFSDRDKKYSDMFLPGVERTVESKLRRPLWGQTDKFQLLARRDPESKKYNYTTIKAGEKRECVAVFNEFDPNANKIRIEIIGLSNDLEAVKRDDGSTEIKERVLVLHFVRRGDEYWIDQDPIYKKGREWIKKTTNIEPGSSGDNSGES